MDRTDFIFYMKNFLDSPTFKDRDIVDDDGTYHDRRFPNLIYFKKIDSVKEIAPDPVVTDIDQRHIPVIYISDKPRVIHLIGGTKYNSKSWSVDRMNDMEGFEYDYAYLHQCEVLGRKPFCRWP